jgi:TPR repeat protein
MNQFERNDFCRNVELANQGNQIYQHLLGINYRDGCDVKQDLKESVYWFKKSALQGNNYSQHELGCCYRYGRGIEVDIKQAIYW